MPDSASPALPLVCHRSAATGWHGGIQAGARLAGGDLLLQFKVDGVLERLRLPDFGGIRRGERLWERSCFEAFVGAEGESGYLELNLAPSGEWAAYSFDSYRRGMACAPAELGEMSVRRSSASLELAARVRIGAGQASAATRWVGLCAVIEDSSGALSYWALRHAGERPDFHRPEARVLRLGAPAALPVSPPLDAA